MMLLIKYFIVYAYFLLVMSVSFVVSKRFRNNEFSRNMIHICAGLGWILYKLLFPATIHPVIISSGFVLLTMITKKMKIRFLERENGSSGTIFFTISMLVMSYIGYKNSLLFNIFGIAIFCLSFGDAVANIVGSRYGTKIIYKKKSVQGMLACFGASVLGMLILRCLFGIALSFTAICFLAILCSITELLTGDYDNIAIPAVIYVTAYIILTNENITHFLISIVVGACMFGVGLRLKLLNLSASYILFFFIFVFFYFGGVKSYISLMLIFSVVIVVEMFLRKKTDKIFLSINKEHGIRNARQLIANCLVSVIAMVIYGITKNEMYIVAFFAAAAETVGDSVASDIGVFSKWEPIDVCSFKRVSKGISGGISILGTGASLIVCMYAGLVYVCIYEIALYNLFAIFISSVAGIMLDSILGSKIQALYRCVVCKELIEKECHCQKSATLVKGCKFFDNTRVNLVCNIFSYTLACLLMTIR